MKRKVAIVGLGVVSPLGNSVPEFTAGVLDGRSAGGEITLFDASKMATRIAAEVRGFDVTSWLGPAGRPLLEEDRSVQFGAAAAEQALVEARAVLEAVEPHERHISLGTSAAYLSPEDVKRDIAPFLSADGEFASLEFLAAGAQRPNSLGKLLYEQMSVWLAQRAAVTGGAKIHYAACAASAQAIGQGMRLITSGRAKVVIAGGFDSMVNPIGVNSFIRLGALTRRNDDPARASRPFDKTRDGFLIGEGSAVLVLADFETAERSNATIYGELAGYGCSLDAHNITAPDPTAAGAVASMNQALRDAGVSADDVGYINAHGTSTSLNDAMETKAIHQVFGARGRLVPVSSSKSMFGHTIGNAGAIELLATLVAMRANKIPPTVNLVEPDKDCDLNHVRGTSLDASYDVAISNSFAFGGQNATLVVRKVA